MGDDALAEIFRMSAPALVAQFERLAGAPGGVARLRELILALAVRGKLVSQEPSDEPASALLQGIRAEKERLIADGRIKPDKASSAAIDQHPFEIPETWIWVSMGEVVEIVRGITFPASEKAKESGPGRIACLRTANVQESIEWDDLLFVSRSFMGREDQLLKMHDIVMSMANSRELVGEVALVDQIPHAESTFGGFLGVLRPWRIDPRYAMAVLRSSYARSTLIDSSSQTTNIANISLGKLRPLPFPLPPLAEQARIVARVDELMQLCDALEAKGRLEAQQHARLLEALLGTLTDSTTPEELAANWQRVAEHFDLLMYRPEAVDVLEQTVLQLAVRGLLVPQDPSDEPASSLLQRIAATKERLVSLGRVRRERPMQPIENDVEQFDLPAGWAWVRLQEAYDVRDGTHDTPKYHETGVPLVTSKNLSSGRLDLTDVKLISTADHEAISARSKVDRHDILFAMIGSIGNPVIVDTDVEFSIKNVALFKHYSLSLSSPEFLLLSLTVAADRMSAQAAGGVQSFISLGQIRSTTIALPPLAEQARIVARVTELRRLCADLRQRLAASQATQSRLAEALVEAATA